MEKMHITNQEHDAFVKSNLKWRFITINEMGRNKKLTGWYARRIAVGRDGEIQGCCAVTF